MSDIPSVTLAGKVYPVPQLVTKQLRIVIPAIMRLSKMVQGAEITTPLYDDMIQILFWGAIWPNNRQATADVLFDTHIPFSEMNAAMKVIRNQTGLFTDAPAEGATPGEVNP